MKKQRLVLGLGLNDLDELTYEVNGDSRRYKKHYTLWKYLLDTVKMRGYTICEEWKKLSNFKNWLNNQGDITGKSISCTVLGSHHWSPETTIFVNSKLIQFFTTKLKDSKNEQGKYPAFISDPFSGKYLFLGAFLTADEARSKWKIKKHEIALQLAKLETDPVIIDVLKTRYL